ncbi:MAG: glycoside hydrolase family 43 protein [Butyrivibrio sp.]|nr:glycoside hydrolase family 43 protein [Butyrivibrio sp.]
MKKNKILSAMTACALMVSGCAAPEITLLDASEIISQGYINKEVISNIGDPYLVTENGKYYVTATCDGKGYDIYSSEDLANWNKEGRIFSSSAKEGWVRTSLWQPQIVIGNDGKYYLYYCGNNDDSSLRIGVAVADSITGPYEDALDHPLLPYDYATIDPNLFTDDDGRMYLYFSRDCSENIVNGHHTSQLYCIEMDGYTGIKEGADPVLVATPEQEWEFASGDYLWNEGPDILKHKGKYYLFYSSGCYADSTYSIGYAVSDSPMGPFTKYDKNPVIASTENVSGPGNNSFFKTLDGKELYTCYHTHTIKLIAGGNRKVTIDRCGFREDGSFYINGPTTSFQTPYSGHGNLEKIDVKNVTAEGTLEGRSPMALIDGETLNSRNEDAYEWRSEKSEKVYAEFDFGQTRVINCIYIYGSANKDYEVNGLNVIFDDGAIKNVSVKACEEGPLVLYFDNKETSGVRIEVADFGSAAGLGLSEVLFYKTR